MAKYDSKTMYNFEKYLKLQKSGDLNMVSPKVQTRLGITKDEHLFILMNYDKILQEYEENKSLDKDIEDAVARAEGEQSEGHSRDYELDVAEPGKEY